MGKESLFDEIRYDAPFEVHGSNAFLLGIKTDKSTRRSFLRILYEKTPIAMTVMGDVIRRNNSFECFESLEAVGIANFKCSIRESRLATVGELSHVLEPSILDRVDRYASFTQVTNSVLYGEYHLEGMAVPNNYKNIDAFSLTFGERKAFAYLAERFILPVSQSINRDFRYVTAADEISFTVSGLRAIEVTDSQVHPALTAALSQYKELNQVLSKLLGRYLLFMDYASDSVSPLSFYTVDYLRRDMQYTQIPYKINQSLSVEKKVRCVGIWEDCQDAVEVELYAQEYVLPSVVVVARKK